MDRRMLLSTYDFIFILMKEGRYSAEKRFYI